MSDNGIIAARLNLQPRYLSIGTQDTKKVSLACLVEIQSPITLLICINLIDLYTSPNIARVIK